MWLGKTIFVPSTGYLYFYQTSRVPEGEGNRSVFVPSTGYLYFYLDKTNKTPYQVSFSSPLRGISISTMDTQQLQCDISVFVPSTGYLYFYFITSFKTSMENMFSSPLRGISISTIIFFMFLFLLIRFRPLYGVSLFLHKIHELGTFYNEVFVPSTGYLYFYDNKREVRKIITVFVPSTGYLYFYKLGMNHTMKYLKFSSPLRGISISTRWKDFNKQC